MTYNPKPIYTITEYLSGPDPFNGPTRCCLCERPFEDGEPWTRTTYLGAGETTGFSVGDHTPGCLSAIATAPTRRATHPHRRN